MTNKEEEKVISKNRRWTPSAISCYLRRCRCAGCYYNNFFPNDNEKCSMKAFIIELIKRNSLPKKLEWGEESILKE